MLNLFSPVYLFIKHPEVLFACKEFFFFNIFRVSGFSDKKMLVRAGSGQKGRIRGTAKPKPSLIHFYVY